MKHLYTTYEGSGKEKIIWLHGLWGGGNYFREIGIPAKFTQQFTHIFPDLLGFGKSPKPDVDYTPFTHAKALFDTFPEGRIHLAGFSLGAIVALNFAKHFPEKVKSLSLLGMPFFKSKEEARDHLEQFFVARLTLSKPHLVKAVCKLFCWTKIPGLVGALYAQPGLRRISLGLTAHRWQSFYSSFTEVLVGSYIDELESVCARVPTLAIYGENDNFIPRGNMDLVEGPGLTKVKLENTWHDLLQERFDETLDEVSKFVRNLKLT